jgi:hypothetical protein
VREQSEKMPSLRKGEREGGRERDSEKGGDGKRENLVEMRR